MSNATESRRERQKRELRHAIRDVALQQLDRGGPGAVSLRGIARELGISAPAIYTYFPGLAELFTELITFSNQSLGDALNAALKENSSDTSEQKLLVGVRAYRSWALGHPRRFNLIFFDQIEGYVAPAGGETVAAQSEMLQALAVPFAAAQSFAPEQLLSDEALMDDFLGWWGSFHGIVALEVNHHFDWRNPESIFLKQVRNSIRELVQRHS